MIDPELIALDTRLRARMKGKRGMYEIAKSFTFDAAHKLEGMPEGHPCAGLHGHTYTVTLILRGEPNARGMVRDYGTLDVFAGWLKARFDHHYLNDVMADNPTAENLACYFYHFAKTLYLETCAVRVSETPRTYAEYRP
jgi:6-pyruvoyltetrahydropterin/6-carboxytetrahydropterin synthase